MRRTSLKAWLVLFGLVGLPVLFLGWRAWRIVDDRRQAEAAALVRMAQAPQDPVPYGVLGSIRLEQGRVTEALPLLAKATAFESQRGGDTQDHLTYAKALIAGAKAGLPGATSELVDTVLKQALVLADTLPKGRRAATYFSAGVFWNGQHERALAVSALAKAVELQPDDWVDNGRGERFKTSGLSGYYQKMLAAAQEGRD